MTDPNVDPPALTLPGPVPCASPPGERPRGFRLRRLGADESGSVAVEYGLVVIPFLAMLFAILETAMIFWTGQVLDDAVTSAVRQVYTGQFQKTNTATLQTAPATMPDKLKTEICSHVVAMFDCASKLTVDVQTYTSFPSSVPSPIVTDNNGVRSIDPNFGQYQNPGPNQIVLVRAIVRYPIFVSLLDANASNLNATTRVLMSTAAFRTEPYI